MLPETRPQPMLETRPRAYHGHRAITSKAYVPRRHLAMPASTDYWINDRSGDPWLVITGDIER